MFSGTTREATERSDLRGRPPGSRPAAAAGKEGFVVETSGYAVGWFTLSLINAGLAQAKNRSGTNWFLVSLLLGPIATLLIVVQKKLPPRE
jgi:hypothetical protein